MAEFGHELEAPIVSAHGAQEPEVRAYYQEPSDMAALRAVAANCKRAEAMSAMRRKKQLVVPTVAFSARQELPVMIHN